MISHSLLSLFDNNYVVSELKLLVYNSLQMCIAVQARIGSGREH